MGRINVTKTFLPPIDEYKTYLENIWKAGQITNQGPLVHELENQIAEKLHISGLHFVANGTIALQIALKALGITEGEVITTPFSYVATTSSILWEHCKPVFVDIDPDSLCIDPSKIEAVITENTKAIMPVHVFGIPCDVEKIEVIAKKHNLKVIYDAAHAFGVEYKERSLLEYGDISTCSFHATKLFHTVEGGVVIAKEETISKKIEVIKRFGHTGDEHFMLGINAKNSELHAAMGLCNLKYVDEIIAQRKVVSELYDKLLGNSVRKPKKPQDLRYNYAYYPIILESNAELLHHIDRLQKENIFPRRYFYPSLNTLPYIQDKQRCPISEDIAERVMCLPLYPDLSKEIVGKICEIITT